MTNIEKLNEQLAALIDDNASKEQIEKVAVIKDIVKDIAADSSKQAEEYKTLLVDYGKLVRGSFSTKSQDSSEAEKQKFDINSFTEDWMKNFKENHKDN